MPNSIFGENNSVIGVVSSVSFTAIKVCGYLKSCCISLFAALVNSHLFWLRFTDSQLPSWDFAECVH